MSDYSISELESLSGIKAHTIRIWEQRYNGLKPKRTPGNTRYYDDNQLRKLLNIANLSQAGMKASELFAFSDKELNDLLDKQIEQNKSANLNIEYFISQMILAGMTYDEAGFDKCFSACLVYFGMKRAYSEVIYPMLVRIGLMWGKDDICPAQEHFISNLIRQKLMSAIDGLPINQSSKKCWLLYLPEDENHDIGLLFSNYLIRLSGQKTVYLGSKVPLDSLKQVALNIKFTDVLFFFVKNQGLNEAEGHLKEINKIFKVSKIHLSGNKKLIEQLNLTSNMDWIKSVIQLEQNYLL